MRHAIITVGLPCSGKSSYHKQLKNKYIRHERDTIQKRIIKEQTGKFSWNNYTADTEKLISAVYNAQLSHYIAEGVDLYLSDDWLSPVARREVIKKLKKRGYVVDILFFDAPAEVCAERNERKRTYRIPKNMFNKMLELLQRYREELAEEKEEFGYNLLTV